MGHNRSIFDGPGYPTKPYEKIDIPASPPPETLTEAQRLANAFANPFGEVLQRAIDFAQQGSIELARSRELLERLTQMEAERVPAIGFATRRLFYVPAEGVKVIDVSELQKNSPTAFTLATFPNGAGDGSPIAGNIYGAFGRSLIEGKDANNASLPPTNFDFITNVGGKIQKYSVRHGLEAFTLWSRTPFIAILYTTTGKKEELPDL